MPKKLYPVNLYNPHEPVSPKIKAPGPCEYNTVDHLSIKEKTKVDAGYLNSVKLSSVFVQENTDRFGNPIHKLSNNYNIPGPSEYVPDFDYTKKKVQTTILSKSKRDINSEKNIQTNKNVGPGCYNSNIEPKKISFFLNQGDKWVS